VRVSQSRTSEIYYQPSEIGAEFYDSSWSTDNGAEFYDTSWSTNNGAEFYGDSSLKISFNMALLISVNFFGANKALPNLANYFRVATVSGFFVKKKSTILCAIFSSLSDSPSLSFNSIFFFSCCSSSLNFSF
jgi:hypothetical protein